MSIGSAGYGSNEAFPLRQRGGLRNKNRIFEGTVQKPGLSSETSVVMRAGKLGGGYEKEKKKKRSLTKDNGRKGTNARR